MQRKEGAYFQTFTLPSHFWLLLLASYFYPFVSSTFSLASSSQVEEKKEKHKEKKNHNKIYICKERKELIFLFLLLHLGWSTPLLSFPHSFNVELSTLLKPYVSRFLEALCYSSSGALPSSGDGMSGKWGEGGRREEVGRSGRGGSR
jgi:hypothetical protein